MRSSGKRNTDRFETVCDLSANMKSERLNELSKTVCFMVFASSQDLVDFAGDELLQLRNVGGELTNALSGFLRRHCVFANEITEFLLVQLAEPFYICVFFSFGCLF
jgi:hypothetical protein